jgi:gas vesicle protein
MCYNQAACNLENLLCWWHALTDEARANPENIKKLVNSTEKVIQSETSSWVEEMREALSELYKENDDSKDKSSNESN